MELAQKKCRPCEGYEKPFGEKETADYILQVRDWEAVDNRKLKKDFKFKNFKEVMNFVNKAADLAQEEQHHPNIYIFFNHVKFELSTHAIGGLSENDFIMAAKIDELRKAL